jgi:hypothetical protein
MEINYILQEIIYTFNEHQVRNIIMRSGQKDVIWKGTFYVNGQNNTFTEYKKWKLHPTKIYLFTVAYTYSDHRIHFVSFILNLRTRQLLCFDPGYNLYPQGKNTIIPTIVNELTKNKIIRKDVQFRTTCPKKYFGRIFGIQYNGGNPQKHIFLAADAFCQTWTIFFLKSFVDHGCSTNFFSLWCKINPKYREYFLIQAFIIPCIMKHSILYKKFHADLTNINDFLLTKFWSTT